MKKSINIFFWAALLILASCASPKKYQDAMELFQRGLDTSIAYYQYKDLKIKAGDNLQIGVYTLASNNQEQTTILNLGGVGKTAGLYIVNNQGQIDLPRIGSLQVEGLTVKELKAVLQAKWAPYVKDLLVNVQLQGFTVNLLGEFKIPGAKTITSEKLTLVDALSLAGGLTDEGKRNDILVIREEQGQRKTYRVDLRDAAFYNSPVYQLQQNDVVYAGISDTKFRQKAFQEFTQKVGPVVTSLSFFNIALGIAILITTLSK